MKPCPPLPAEELFILVGFLSATPSALKRFLIFDSWTDFALPRWVGESLTVWIKLLGLWGCWKFWVIVFTNGSPTSNFANHSTSLRLWDKHSYAVYLPGCGEVKIRSNALQTRKELSNLRSDSCSWQSSFQLIWIMESRQDTLKISCHLPSSRVSRPSSLITALEPDCPNRLDLWFSGLAAHRIIRGAFIPVPGCTPGLNKSETQDGSQA